MENVPARVTLFLRVSTPRRSLARFETSFKRFDQHTRRTRGPWKLKGTARYRLGSIEEAARQISYDLFSYTDQIHYVCMCIAASVFQLIYSFAGMINDTRVRFPVSQLNRDHCSYEARVVGVQKYSCSAQFHAASDRLKAASA